MSLLPLNMIARWRSRHFTAVTALGPQEVELEHSICRSFVAVVVSCGCSGTPHHSVPFIAP